MVLVRSLSVATAIENRQAPPLLFTDRLISFTIVPRGIVSSRNVSIRYQKSLSHYMIGIFFIELLLFEYWYD